MNDIKLDKLSKILRASATICGECPDSDPDRCDGCIVRRIVDDAHDRFCDQPSFSERG